MKKQNEGQSSCWYLIRWFIKWPMIKSKRTVNDRPFLGCWFYTALSLSTVRSLSACFHHSSRSPEISGIEKNLIMIAMILSTARPIAKLISDHPSWLSKSSKNSESSMSWQELNFSTNPSQIRTLLSHTKKLSHERLAILMSQNRE